MEAAIGKLETKRVDFSRPDYSDIEIEEVIDTIKSGWITTGPKTKYFESELSKYCSTDRTICLNSATAGLELILRLFGIGEGDEVIASAYTYTATASVICHVGAKPILIDTAIGSYEMDYEKVEAAITSKTKAVISTDLAGVMCDYGRIHEIAVAKRNIFISANEMQQSLGRLVVIADAAHSFGAVNKGEKSGQAADFSCFSFHAIKNLTTSEGGAVTWRRNDALDNNFIYSTLNQWSLHGQSKDALAKTVGGTWEYDILFTGWKCNMTDISASLGIAQLKRYSVLLERRRQIINYYDSELKGEELHILNHFGKDFSSSGHLYMTRLKDKSEQYRNTVIRKMNEAGIAVNVHYKPLPMMTAYKNLGFKINDFPNAYDMYKNEITLPLHTLLTEEQIEWVVRCYKNIIVL